MVIAAVYAVLLKSLYLFITTLQQKSYMITFLNLLTKML